MLTRLSFHSATISAIFEDYNSLLMLENSPFNVIITNKIPTFVRFMKLADSVILRKNESSCNFTSSGMLPIPKQKLSGDYQLSMYLVSKIQAF